MLYCVEALSFLSELHVKRIDIMIMGAHEDHPAGHRGRGDDAPSGGVAPQLASSLGGEGIERVIHRANVDHLVDHDGRGEDAIAGKVVPLFLASDEIERVHSMVV